MPLAHPEPLMTFHATRACELIGGLDDVTVLAVDEHRDGLTC